VETTSTDVAPDNAAAITMAAENAANAAPAVAVPKSETRELRGAIGDAESTEDESIAHGPSGADAAADGAAGSEGGEEAGAGAAEAEGQGEDAEFFAVVRAVGVTVPDSVVYLAQRTWEALPWSHLGLPKPDPEADQAWADEEIAEHGIRKRLAYRGLNPAAGPGSAGMWRIRVKFNQQDVYFGTFRSQRLGAMVYDALNLLVRGGAPDKRPRGQPELLPWWRSLNFPERVDIPAFLRWDAARERHILRNSSTPMPKPAAGANGGAATPSSTPHQSAYPVGRRTSAGAPYGSRYIYDDGSDEDDGMGGVDGSRRFSKSFVARSGAKARRGPYFQPGIGGGMAANALGGASFLMGGNATGYGSPAPGAAAGGGVPASVYDQAFDVTTGRRYRGVQFRSKEARWDAITKINERAVSAGLFATAEIAARAYDKLVLALRGREALTALNFPFDGDRLLRVIEEERIAGVIPPVPAEIAPYVKGPGRDMDAPLPQVPSAADDLDSNGMASKVLYAIYPEGVRASANRLNNAGSKPEAGAQDTPTTAAAAYQARLAAGNASASDVFADVEEDGGAPLGLYSQQQKTAAGTGPYDSDGTSATGDDSEGRGYGGSSKRPRADGGASDESLDDGSDAKRRRVDQPQSTAGAVVPSVLGVPAPAGYNLPRPGRMGLYVGSGFPSRQYTLLSTDGTRFFRWVHYFPDDKYPDRPWAAKGMVLGTRLSAGRHTTLELAALTSDKKIIAAFGLAQARREDLLNFPEMGPALAAEIESARQRLGRSELPQEYFVTYNKGVAPGAQGGVPGQQQQQQMSLKAPPPLAAKDVPPHLMHAHLAARTAQSTSGQSAFHQMPPHMQAQIQAQLQAHLQAQMQMQAQMQAHVQAQMQAQSHSQAQAPTQTQPQTHGAGAWFEPAGATADQTAAPASGVKAFSFQDLEKAAANASAIAAAINSGASTSAAPAVNSTMASLAPAASATGGTTTPGAEAAGPSAGAGEEFMDEDGVMVDGTLVTSAEVSDQARRFVRNNYRLVKADMPLYIVPADLVGSARTCQRLSYLLHDEVLALTVGIGAATNKCYEAMRTLGSVPALAALMTPGIEALQRVALRCATAMAYNTDLRAQLSDVMSKRFTRVIPGPGLNPVGSKPKQSALGMQHGGAMAGAQSRIATSGAKAVWASASGAMQGRPGVTQMGYPTSDKSYAAGISRAPTIHNQHQTSGAIPHPMLLQPSSMYQTAESSQSTEIRFDAPILEEAGDDQGVEDSGRDGAARADEEEQGDADDDTDDFEEDEEDEEEEQDEEEEEEDEDETPTNDNEKDGDEEKTTSSPDQKDIKGGDENMKEHSDREKQ
jgi:hypothetical protein